MDYNSCAPHSKFINRGFTVAFLARATGRLFSIISRQGLKTLPETPHLLFDLSKCLYLLPKQEQHHEPQSNRA